MKVAFWMLAIKDGATAFKELVTPWMVVFGSLSMLIVTLAWLGGWDIIPVVITCFSVFAASALGVGVSVTVEALADLIIALTGHNEVELEEKRAI